MKKTLVMLVSILVIGTPVLAQTTVDTEWEGSGHFETHFVAGDDANSDFWTTGSYIKGEYHAIDKDDNPYGYGIDTVDAWVKASVSDGFMEFLNERKDSHERMYGRAGQISYTYIWTNESAEMAFGTNTNYARLRDCQYSRNKTTQGRQFEATGNHYIYHMLTDSDGDGAALIVDAVGSSKVRLMGSESWGSSFNFGSLPVCGDGCAWYDHYADFEGSGKGDFYLHGWADNELTIGCCGHGWTIPGDGSDDSAAYDLHVRYAGDWSYPDLGIKGE